MLLALVQEVTPNGINAVAAAAAAYATQPEAPESIQPQAQSQPQAVELEESHTIEDLDIEVSQINTQNKTQSEPAESYSRPMSRTSSMTPVNS